MLALEHSLDGRIATVTLNRPEKRNALNNEIVTELTSVLHSLRSDEFLRVVVLTGAGSVFSAGADLASLQLLQTRSAAENLEDSRLLASLFLEICSSPLLIVAKVNGHAIAGGSGLVAACDVSFATDKAKLGFTETRIGFVPALVQVLLKGKLSDTASRDLLLSGRLIEAKEAQRLQLVTHTCSHPELDAKVDDYLADVCRNTSRSAIALTKQRFLDDMCPSLATRLEAAAQSNAEARMTDDCKSGISAFLEKNSAPWVKSFDDDHRDPA